MTKASVIKQLETIIGKIMDVSYKIDGGMDLQAANRLVANVRDKLQSGQIKLKKR